MNDIPITITAGGAEVQTTLAGMVAVSALRAGTVPKKNTPADIKVSDDAYRVAGDELRQFIEQYEQLATEKQDIADQQKEVMAEAKGRGFDTKAIGKIIAMRKRDADDLAEEQAVLDLYCAALGMR